MEEYAEDFKERLLKIEAESGIFELKVHGIRLWQYVRWYCLVEILYEVTGKGQTNITSMIFQNESAMSLRERIEHQQFLLRKKDIVVFNHPRRVKEGKYYRCFVTETLLENLDCSYYVFENAYWGQHFRPAPTKNLKYVNINGLRKIFKVRNEDIDRQLKKFYKSVIQTFEKDNQIVLSEKLKRNIFNHIYGSYDEICLRTIWAKIVFTIVRPKICIVTSPYPPGMGAIVAEAKKRHIATIEMQHGIAPGHFFYDYLYEGTIDIFPDYIFAYGRHESDMHRYPIERNRIIPVGYPDLEKRARKCQREKSGKQKTILFISSTEKVVAEYAIKLRRNQRLKDMRILYKFHPAEYNMTTAKDRFQNLADNGVEVIAENKHDIYFYLGQADYVVGNVSTVLYEATEFNVQIYIICGGNYEGSAMLYENGYAQLVTSADMLADEILNSVPENKKKDSYFEKNAITNMKRELDRIMSGKKEF